MTSIWQAERDKTIDQEENILSLRRQSSSYESDLAHAREQIKMERQKSDQNHKDALELKSRIRNEEARFEQKKAAFESEMERRTQREEELSSSIRLLEQKLRKSQEADRREIERLNEQHASDEAYIEETRAHLEKELKKMVQMEDKIKKGDRKRRELEEQIRRQEDQQSSEKREMSRQHVAEIELLNNRLEAALRDVEASYKPFSNLILTSNEPLNWTLV